MVDVNQQWDRTTALRMGKAMEEFNLEWLEEPLDAYDVEGHAAAVGHVVNPFPARHEQTGLELRHVHGGYRVIQNGLQLNALRPRLDFD